MEVHTEYNRLSFVDVVVDYYMILVSREYVCKVFFLIMLIIFINTKQEKI